MSKNDDGVVGMILLDQWVPLLLLSVPLLIPCIPGSLPAEGRISTGTVVFNRQAREENRISFITEDYGKMWIQ